MESISGSENYSFRYWISLDDPSREASVADFPKLWFEARPRYGHQDTIVPYLVPLLQPSPGMYTVTSLTYAERRFITSSGIKDALTGSKPVRDVHIALLPNTKQISVVDLWKSHDDVSME